MSKTKAVVENRVNFKKLPLVALLFCGALAQAATPGVFSNRYDNARTGANLQETVLTTANVNTANFGKLFSYPVDGAIYAQPLYVANVSIPNVGTKNVLIVATMEDTVYGFDADGGGLLWRRDLKNPAAGVTAVPIASLVNPNYGDIDPSSSVGIEGTPVIDPATKTVYLVARTLESGSFVQRLHGFDVATGVSRPGSGVAIKGTSGVNTFNPKIENQRTGLVLTNGQVVVAWAGHQDFYDYHGWVMSFDKTSFARTGAFSVTDGAWGGGIWSSGRAPVVLDNGDIALFTGNGIGQAGQAGYDGVKNFSESVVRMSVGPTGLKVVDWFTPANWQALDNADADLASSGPALIPGSGYLVGGGKEGQLYVVNSANMGKMQAGNPKLIQTLAASPGHEIKGGPVLWDRRAAGASLLMYNWSDTDQLKAWNWMGNAFSATPLKTGLMAADSPGGFLSLSANGSASGSGVVWALSSNGGDASHAIRHGVLRAFDAEDITRELWNSATLAADDFGNFAKFNPPMVANGKVYVATFSKQVNAYGLRTQPKPPTPSGNTSPVFGTATGGTAFADPVTAGQSMTGITLRTGWWIDSIQALTSPTASAVHGGTGGGVVNVTWPAGEYVVRLYGKYGSGAISQLSFVTNTGRVLGPYGSDQGQGTTTPFDYTVPTGQRVVGFAGTSGAYLNTLAVEYAPVSKTSPVFGGSTSGSSFVDPTTPTQKMTGVNLRTGWWIDSIQGVTSTGTLSAHGGAGGGLVSVTWPANESLVRIYGKYGSTAIAQISFVTNTGRVLGPYGLNQGQGTTIPFDFTAPAGTTIQGFLGRSGAYLDALGVTVGP